MNVPPQFEAPPPEPTLLERARAAPVTWSLTAINIAVFLWAESKGSTTETITLLRFGAIEPIHVWSGDYWRLATYMFLHIGWMHLLWNTWASIGWGTAVEQVLGRSRFLAVYLLAGIGGGAVSVIFSPAVSAGASGAMFGIVGATLAIRRRQLPSFAAFFADKATRSVFVNIAIWTVIGLTALSMNHYAHFGGLLIGAVATWIVTSARPRLGWGVFAVLFAVLLAFAARPWWRPTGDAALRAAAYASLYLETDGKEPPKDLAKGERLASKACAAGATKACAYLADALASTGEPEKVTRAFDLFHKACADGDVDACAGEGRAVANGAGTAADEARGLAMVKKACEDGSKWACSMLDKNGKRDKRDKRDEE
jgi:rhomboid protease GluP